MPIVKPISGHTGCGGVLRYLTKDGRALAVDTVNLGQAPWPVCTWRELAEEMDFTRVAFGNHAPWRGRPARTYKHYILSPDPVDSITLEGMRDFARAWVAEHFGDFQVAIVYHDDNEGGIMHAHVVVNNTNLETGARLQDPDPRALKRSAQRLAEERGLSYFPETRDEGARVAFGGQRGGPGERVHLRRAERELARKGEYSWVADIRARVLVARRCARDEADFAAVLGELGVEVSAASPRNGGDDWLFALAGEGARRIRGENLGTSFGRRAIRQELLLRSAPDRAEALRRIAREAVEVGDLAELGTLAEVVDACAREGIRCLADFDARIASLESAGDFGGVERMSGLREYAEEKGLLPARARAPRRGRSLPPADPAAGRPGARVAPTAQQAPAGRGQQAKDRRER